MHRSVRLAFIVTLLSVLLGASAAFSQIVQGQPLTTGGRIIFSHFSLDNGTQKIEIDQFAIPVSGMIPLRDNTEMRFFIANTSNDLSDATDEYSVNGLGDFRVQVSQSLKEDKFLISAGVNIPTGKTKLDAANEFPVMSYLSQNYIDMPIRRLGEGPGFNLLIGAAQAWGEIRYGMTAMFQMYGKYKAYDGGGDYDPGDLFSVSVNADRRWESLILGFNGIFSTYSTDKLDGKKIFAQSDQFDLRLNGVYRAGGVDIAGMMQFINRGRNTRYDSLGALYDQLKFYGNEFAVGTSVSFMAAEALSLTPAAEFRFIGGNEYGFEKSNLMGFGLEAQYRFSEMLDAVLGYKLYTGKADNSGIDIGGYQLTAGFTAGF